MTKSNCSSSPSKAKLKHNSSCQSLWVKYFNETAVVKCQVLEDAFLGCEDIWKWGLCCVVEFVLFGSGLNATVQCGMLNIVENTDFFLQTSMREVGLRYNTEEH